MTNRVLSKKQKWIMTVIADGNKDATGAIESWVDLDQIIERVPYEVTKAAIQFSLRYLARAGYIIKQDREVRRERSRRVFAPTLLCTQLVGRFDPAIRAEIEDHMRSKASSVASE